MRQLLPLLRKELIQLRRDPKVLPLLFVAPVIQLIILGYAATTDVKQVALALCDLDRTPTSRAITDRFLSSRYFRLQAVVSDQRSLDYLLTRGRVQLALTIPAGLEKGLERGEAVAVQILVDGSDPTSGITGLAYAREILAQATGGSRPSSVDLRPLVLYNPDLISRNFMIPAVLAMIIMVTTMMLAAMALVRERELGTWEQLLLAPIPPHLLLAGKVLPYALVGFVEIFSALPVVFYYFRVPLRGSLLLLLVLCLPFVLATLGLGLLVSTFSHTQQQAMMLSSFGLMLPQIYLSGFIFPIENMPPLFQWLTYAVPLRYFVTILRGIFLKGVGLEILWPQVLALLVLDAIILTAARFRLRRTVL